MLIFVTLTGQDSAQNMLAMHTSVTQNANYTNHLMLFNTHEQC